MMGYISIKNAYKESVKMGKHYAKSKTLCITQYCLGAEGEVKE